MPADLYYCIIDDDAFTCLCLKKLLQRYGAEEMAIFEDAADAVSWIDDPDNNPDIIICDLNMPKLNGVEFMLHLAKRKFPGGIILISTTTQLLNTIRNLAHAHSLNVIGTVGKPFVNAEIQNLLAAYVPRKSSSAQTGNS